MSNQAANELATGFKNESLPGSFTYSKHQNLRFLRAVALRMAMHRRREALDPW